MTSCQIFFAVVLTLEGSNSADPDVMQHSITLHLGLPVLFTKVCKWFNSEHDFSPITSQGLISIKFKLPIAI